MKILLLFITMLLPIMASAQNIEIDGIYYNIITKVQIAEVIQNPQGYSGDIIIPPSITYKGIDYPVKSIGNSAFYYCSSITSIIIPNSVTSIGEHAFGGCSSLTSITIPNSVTSIEAGVFEDCSSITSITIPNSVTEIGGFAFKGCSSLINITIPNSVTSIRGYAFSSCSSLINITIPNSVTTIENKAFELCKELTDVYCYAEDVPLTEIDAFNDSFIESATLHVPTNSVNAYKTTEPWKNFGTIVAIKDIIPGDVNGDGLVNVTDIVATVNYIMEKPSEGFNKEAADLNGDGEINVTDIVKMVSIIMDASAREMEE